ncbi:MAG: hypothetical protein GKR91_11685 [Pseudomonadales bacterium]|nr:hypothetical protein [Pseudomonadales bacterium]
MKTQLVKATLPFLCLIAVISLVSFSSNQQRQKESNDRSVVKVDNKHVEIAPAVEGRIPALDYFIDDPHYPTNAVRKSDLQNSTDFDHLSEIHPLIKP